VIYLSLKTLHILSAILLFGTGLGSAFYKFMADRRGEVGALAVVNRHVVLADWLFTTPAIVIQPLTGLALLHVLGLSWNTPWALWSFALYFLAGACWLPVVWLQIRMRDLAEAAWREHTPLPPLYRRYARLWFWLGVPAFGAMVAVVGLMVFKPM
jgi:uncharacterized membrane protein